MLADASANVTQSQSLATEAKTFNPKQLDVPLKRKAEAVENMAEVLLKKIRIKDPVRRTNWKRLVFLFQMHRLSSVLNQRRCASDLLRNLEEMDCQHRPLCSDQNSKPKWKNTSRIALRLGNGIQELSTKLSSIAGQRKKLSRAFPRKLLRISTIPTIPKILCKRVQMHPEDIGTKCKV